MTLAPPNLATLEALKKRFERMPNDKTGRRDSILKRLETRISAAQKDAESLSVPVNLQPATKQPKK
jgi:hypothetical protein